jgi:lipopolysaccharide transport system permease protein
LSREELAMALEKKVYTSSNSYSLSKILKQSLHGYADSFYLAKQLAKRDLRAQYRQSVLGILWAFAPVLMSATVWIFLNLTGTVKVAQTNIPYPLYVVIGTTIWSVFGECLLMSINSVNANKSIITKINFQKEALVTLGLIKVLFNLLIKMSLVIALMLVYHIPVSLSLLWFVPVLVISMLAFISIGIFLTPIAILYHDITRVIPVIMQIAMYLTPVVYNIPGDGFMKTLMELNPLTYLVTDLRNTLTGYPLENPVFLLVFTAGTLLFSLLAMIIYRTSMPIITERMSA